MAEPTSTPMTALHMAADQAKLPLIESSKLKTLVEEPDNEYTDEARLKRIPSRGIITKNTFCCMEELISLVIVVHSPYTMDLPIKKESIDYGDEVWELRMPVGRERKEKILKCDSYFGNSADVVFSSQYFCGCRQWFQRATRRNKGNISTFVKQMSRTGNKCFEDNDEPYEDNILYTKGELDWDCMASKLQDKSTLNKYGDMDVANEGCSITAHVRNYDDILHPTYQVYKITSQLQEKSTGGNLNASKGNGMKVEKEEKEEPFSLDKRREIVRRVSFYVAATTVFFGLIFDLYTPSPIVLQHQPLDEQQSPVFSNWFSLLELFGFMVFIWAIVATIVVGAPFSRIQSGMVMFWSIWMLVRSAKSITEVFVPMWGIVLMGRYMLMEKQPQHT